jgi:hypothetical protein
MDLASVEQLEQGAAGAKRQPAAEAVKSHFDAVAPSSRTAVPTLPAAPCTSKASPFLTIATR